MGDGGHQVVVEPAGRGIDPGDHQPGSAEADSATGGGGVGGGPGGGEDTHRHQLVDQAGLQRRPKLVGNRGRVGIRGEQLRKLSGAGMLEQHLSPLAAASTSPRLLTRYWESGANRTMAHHLSFVCHSVGTAMKGILGTCPDAGGAPFSRWGRCRQ